MVKYLPAMQETWVQSLGWEDPLEKETATLSSILSWGIPWTEKPGFLATFWTLCLCVCMCVCARVLMYVLIWENIHALSFIDLNLWENIILVENPERPMDISSALVSWQHTRTHY